MAYDLPTLIRLKRDGHSLSQAQIKWLISRYCANQIAEEQMAALLMAIYFQGMTYVETAHWTKAMIASGGQFSFLACTDQEIHRPRVDKHSTGGVGDKLTLPLLGIMAACGVMMPSASGRGLGHTGGTVDKLESIRGLSTYLESTKLQSQLDRIGAAIFSADEFIPADSKLYLLRDLTATVESLPLMASSIMSKKIAENLQGLVLDIKVGSGAFMKTLPQAHKLSDLLVYLAQSWSLPMTVLFTNMDQPLGNTVGNALEVEESLQILTGEGPSDVTTLTLELAREMLTLAGREYCDPLDVLINGQALTCFRDMVTAQGGDLESPLPHGKCKETFAVSHGGIINHIDAHAIGMAAWRLGAGRTSPGESIQPGAGIQLYHRQGDSVIPGEALCCLYTDTPNCFSQAIDELATAFYISDAAPEQTPLILQRIYT